MRKLYALLILIPLIMSFQFPHWEWKFDWNFNSILDKFKTLVPDFIKNMQNKIKDFMQQTDQKKNEILTNMNTKLVELHENIKNDIQEKRKNVQNKMKELAEKATETAKYLSYKVCDIASMDYEECRNDKKKLLSNLLGVVKENFGECSVIIGEIARLTENFELNLKYILFLVNAISENPDALEKGKSQIVLDIIHCLQEKFEQYWPFIQARLGDQEFNVKLDVTNLMVTTFSNLVKMVQYEEMDGYIERADEKTGLIPSEKAKQIHVGLLKILKKLNEFGEGLYNISTNCVLNIISNPGNLDVSSDAEVRWINNDDKGIRIALHSNYMLREKGAQSLQAIVFDSPLVSLRGSREREGGTSNTFVGITLYDKDGNEILVKDFNIEDLRPEIFFKKSLFGAMKTCLYYNEDSNTVESTGILSSLVNINGEEFIKCIPKHLSTFTIGSYEKSEINLVQSVPMHPAQPGLNNKTIAIIIASSVISTIALLVAGFFIYRCIRRKSAQSQSS